MPIEDVAGAVKDLIGNTFWRVKPSVVIVHTGSDQSASIAGQAEDRGVGLGVLISKDGKILTAAHLGDVCSWPAIGCTLEPLKATSPFFVPDGERSCWRR